MDYPWYEIVNGDDIEQGDIIENCPVLSLPSDMSVYSVEPSNQLYEIPFEARDVVILSQTCDMVKGQEKISEVLLCAMWRRSDLDSAEPMQRLKKWEDARKGRRPAFHVLNKCELERFERDFALVDFRRVHSLPLEGVRNVAQGMGERLRLLPPYREHLSQAFARFFMRVGLPTDIPPFC